MSEDPYLKDIGDASDAIRYVQHYLEDLSSSFADTGNEIVAGKLAHCAQDLQRARRKMQSAVSAEINRQYTQARQETANLLQAAVSSIPIKEGAFFTETTQMVCPRRGAVIDKLREIQKSDDMEVAHQQADEVLTDFLNALGYSDIVEEYEKIGKWYA